MVAELLLIGPTNVTLPRFGRITHAVKVSEMHTLTKQINHSNPDGLVVNTLDKGILRYTLLHSTGRPVIKLTSSPDLLKISDLFEVYQTPLVGKAYLYGVKNLGRIISKTIPKKYFTSLKHADYILDLTCMEGKPIKLFEQPQSIQLAVKNRLPIFVLTPIQSLYTLDAILYRSYEAIMLEYPVTTIARIPSLVEVGLEFPKVKKEILCVHLSKLPLYINSLWATYKQRTNNPDRIVEFLDGDHLLSEDLELLLEANQNL
jgi:hypothetical protein